MAFYQIAYTFDAERFHADLEAKVVKGGVFDFTELQRLARAIMANPSDEVKKIAHFEGYGKKWLEDDARQKCHWYTVNLWGVLKPCPSLSNNRLYESHFVLEQVLPQAGWPEEDICALIFGQWGEKRFESEDESVNLRPIWPYRHYLNVAESARLLRQLDECQSFFLAPKGDFPNSADARELLDLALAYWDARDMLETAIHRNEALYLSRG